MNNIIEIKDLCYKEILNNLDISFNKNKFYTISGSNNSGKTTLIRVLSNKYNIKNSIYINDKDITNYQIKEFNKLIGTVIPFEIEAVEDTLLNELIYQEIDIDFIDFILKGLKIKGISKLPIEDLSKRNKILVQIAKELSKKPKVLLLDSISCYLSNKDMKDLYKFLRIYQERYELTIINTTINLEDALLSDYIYILSDGIALLEGLPEEILQLDNILNKLGLNVPFMMDLAVKLRDYDLLEDIELNKDRMVDILWK